MSEQQLQEKEPCSHFSVLWYDEEHNETGHIEAGYYCTRCNARFAILPMSGDLKQADENIGLARSVLVELVRLKRIQRWSWDKIGKELGVSRQAAWERFHKEVDDGQQGQAGGEGDGA